MRLARASLSIGIVAICMVCATALATAQTRKRDRPRAAPTAPPAGPSDAGARSDAAPQRVEAPTTPARVTVATSDAGASDRSPDGGSALRFGELEIEGRLRNPQLLYFLRRVRAEFAPGELGHRPFMQELSESKSDDAL